AVQLTESRGTGLPYWSATRTTRDSGWGAPNALSWLSPATLMMLSAGPARALARNTANTSGAPELLSTARASTRWLSAVRVPSVQRSRTRPLSLVIAAPANTLPPPAVTRKLTSWPLIGVFVESTMRATNGAESSEPATADCESPDTTSNAAG